MRTLTDLIAARGLTTRQVADSIGVDNSTVWRWEAGRNGPSAEQLVKLARLLGLTPDYVLRALASGVQPPALERAGV